MLLATLSIATGFGGLKSYQRPNLWSSTIGFSVTDDRLSTSVGSGHEQEGYRVEAG